MIYFPSRKWYLGQLYEYRLHHYKVSTDVSWALWKDHKVRIHRCVRPSETKPFVKPTFHYRQLHSTVQTVSCLWHINRTNAVYSVGLPVAKGRTVPGFRSYLMTTCLFISDTHTLLTIYRCINWSDFWWLIALPVIWYSTYLAFCLYSLYINSDSPVFFITDVKSNSKSMQKVLSLQPPKFDMFYVYTVRCTTPSCKCMIRELCIC